MAGKSPYERLLEAGLLGDEPLTKNEIDMLNTTLSDEDVDHIIDVSTRLKEKGGSPGIRL